MKPATGGGRKDGGELLDRFPPPPSRPTRKAAAAGGLTDWRDQWERSFLLRGTGTCLADL